jgi:hypothetical protein
MLGVAPPRNGAVSQCLIYMLKSSSPPHSHSILQNQREIERESVCVCVRVGERERERERDGEDPYTLVESDFGN